MRRVFVTIALAVAAGMGVWTMVPTRPVAAAQKAADSPKLMVLLVVDQFRTDYLDRYGPHWTGGLKRLIQEGAWYTNAAYPYLHTVTCAGHATLGTGRFPRSHGIIMNSWFDRERGGAIDCSADTRASTVTAAGLIPGGHSNEQLRANTLADKVKSDGGRVVTMSLKPRSAIMPAGRRPDAAIWFGGQGEFVTSTAYTKELPAFVRTVLSEHPIPADRASSPWLKLMPPEAYSGEDDALGEKPPGGWSASVPHPFDLPQFFALWQSTAHSDEYLGRLAAAAIDSYKLGQGQKVDFLSVSFSALDLVGHAFGPESHEVQDLLARLDRTIGALLTHLDERVGRGNYVLALSADHGVAPIPEQMTRLGRDAGRIDTRQVAQAIDTALESVLGEGPYVSAVVYTDVYFNPHARNRVMSNRKALEAAKQAALSSPGIERVFDANELKPSRIEDPVQRGVSLSWYKNRSGDLIVVPKRQWIASSAATTHGTLHDYDQRVPLIVFGSGKIVTPGRFTAPATPADVSPTLAAIARVRFETPDGRVLPVHP
jgi:hypothetical protein